MKKFEAPGEIGPIIVVFIQEKMIGNQFLK